MPMVLDAQAVLVAWLLSLGQVAVYGTVVFAVVWALNRLVPSRLAGLRHALWGLVLLRLVLPADLGTPYSLAHWTRATFERSSPPVALPTTIFVVPGAKPTLDHAASPNDLADDGGAWWWLAGLGWLLGASAIWWLGIRQRRACHQLLRSARPVAEPRALDLMTGWRRRLRIRRPVRLVHAATPCMPFTLGSIRPTIYLPDSVLNHPDPMVLESVVAHELAHIHRWDDLWLGLQRVAQGLFFFHPIAWWVASAMQREREHDCDVRVLDSGSISSRHYGRSLLNVVGLDLQLPNAVAAVAAPRSLAMRIRTIARHAHPTAPQTLPQRVMDRGLRLLPLALGLVLLPMAAVSLSGEQPASAEPETTGVADAKPVLDFRLSKTTATFDRLLPGAIVTSSFGNQTHPITKQPRHHDGVDLVGAEETVYAPQGGVVKLATERYPGGADYGTVAIIDHGSGVESFYAHLDSLAIETGQSIQQGDVIGTVGETGVATGPHLHFELWRDGQPIDPIHMAGVFEDC